MSRSRRRTSIFGHTTAQFDHLWKKASARNLRRSVKQRLAATLDGDRFAGKRWDIVNPWSSEKDGKHFWTNPPARFMRK